jgi:hypothetical protein
MSEGGMGYSLSSSVSTGSTVEFWMSRMEGEFDGVDPAAGGGIGL